MKNFISLLIIFATLNTYANQWNLNDVTYIMPLPTNADENNLLKLKSTGLGGELLKPEFLKEMPVLSIRHNPEEISQRLRVVTVRIDPCFPLPTPTSCQKQIRLVWQPVSVDKQKNVITLDMALHSFYVLTDEEFKLLTSDLLAWKKLNNSKVQNESTALDIHPFWKNQKDQSPALLQFNEIVLKYAGHKNLSRITAMVLRRMDDVWGFVAFDVSEDKKLKALEIPRLGKNQSQLFTTDINVENIFRSTIMNPVPETKEDNLHTFITSTQTFTEDELLSNYKMALKIENPKAFSPENMDCVNCHIAQPARQLLAEQKTWPNLQEEYKNPNYDLTNKSTKLLSTKQMRGVGYFNDRLVIAQRVINESAEVADWLNSKSEKKKQ